MTEVRFVTEPPPELTLDRAGELNARFPTVMALDLPGIILRQWGTNVHEVTSCIKSAAPDFELNFLSFVPFDFATKEKGYGRGLHNDPDPSPDGARRINVTFVEAGPLEITTFQFSPELKTRVIAGAGRSALLPLGSPHAELYKQGLVDLDWFSPFAHRGTLQTGDGFLFADVNAHDFTHYSFPRISVAHLFEAKPKKRFVA